MVKPVCGKIPGKKKKKNNIDHLHLWFFHFLVGYAAWDQNQIDWYVITRLFFSLLDFIIKILVVHVRSMMDTARSCSLFLVLLLAC